MLCQPRNSSAARYQKQAPVREQHLAIRAGFVLRPQRLAKVTDKVLAVCLVWKDVQEWPQRGSSSKSTIDSTPGITMTYLVSQISTLVQSGASMS
jgi:hypothetical protein